MLAEPGADAKPARARAVAAAWRAGELDSPGAGAGSLAPDRPARPDRPELKPPGQVPRRRLGTPAGRFALLHAVAHIEFNAIDLAFDMVARFSGDDRLSKAERRAFISDWIAVGDDEARHFLLVREQLARLGGDYGDLPAHDGLWEAASATANDLMGRLAVAPMVLEARGLDVTPGMIEKLNSVGDRESAAALEIIYTEEVAHVAAGRRWFETLCAAEGDEPEGRFQALVKQYFKGDLKRPFNIPARTSAGMPQDWYAPLGV
ncbi:MAG: ferritin-like domain-containing protein [Oceanicaulis sp.]